MLRVLDLFSGIARFFRGFPEIGEIEPTICGGVDGIPGYAHRLKGLGNAVVPQIPELIGRAILKKLGENA